MPRHPSAAARPRRSHPITTPAAPNLAGHALSSVGHAPSPLSSATCSVASRAGPAVPLCLPCWEDSGGQAEVMGGHGEAELVQFKPAAIDCGVEGPFSGVR
ncbi:hypothetical protein D1007_00460 [Hordeum vulgare]|nr:hypothetical protein D1007_00460 [Hordeum vulgare]